MPCYRPVKGFRGVDGGISWRPAVSFVDMPMEVPCGQCIGCRLERSRQWAVRMMHEAQCHEHKSFITLTYDDEHLPRDWSLNKVHFQKFMKRVRKKFSGRRISYFHCGEYGEENRRPHYHAILFGLDFPDGVVVDRSVDGSPIYESATLAALWPYGFSTVGAVTFESAAYVARYVLKKVTGDAAIDHYRRYDPESGEVYYLQPEYCTMSLRSGESRGGIGADWFCRFAESDVVSRDAVVFNGVLQRPPRYYDKLRGREAMRAVKRERVRGAVEHVVDQSPERLAVREEVKRAQVSMLKRRV